MILRAIKPILLVICIVGLIFLPMSAASGAVFMILADGIARTLLSPAELPVGVVTAFCGAPFFLYLLRQRKNLAC